VIGIAGAHVQDGLAALLRGERVAWSALGTGHDEVLATVRDEGLTGLVHQSLRRISTDWPSALVEAIAREARAAAAAELIRARELARVLGALDARGIATILLKGTPLAYSVYDSPALRPRDDTDLLIRAGDADAVRRAMRDLGYSAPVYCDDVHYQFPFEQRDEFGVDHAFDFHWRLSTQAAFADLLTFDELASETVSIPALGPDARAAGNVHGLLLACVHPAMHHQNVERLIWVYDVHQLVGRMTPADLDRFAGLAVAKGVAAICAQELSRAQQRFGTPVPAAVVARLHAATGEPSAAYLDPGRTWKDELISNVGALGWRDRLRLIRRVAFPDLGFMLRSYGLRTGTVDAALLPALYVHRGLRGLWKVATGRK
jgi:hypothetical protein